MHINTEFISTSLTSYNTRTEMYAGRVAFCLVSHVECRIKVGKKDGTDRRTDGRQTVTLRLSIDAASIVTNIRIILPAKARSMFYRRWFVCLSVTTITKRIVDGFVPNFCGKVPRGKGKGRPSSCVYDRYRGMWK